MKGYNCYSYDFQAFLQRLHVPHVSFALAQELNGSRPHNILYRTKNQAQFSQYSRLVKDVMGKFSYYREHKVCNTLQTCCQSQIFGIQLHIIQPHSFAGYIILRLTFPPHTSPSSCLFFGTAAAFVFVVLCERSKAEVMEKVFMFSTPPVMQELMRIIIGNTARLFQAGYSLTPLTNLNVMFA